MAVSVSGGRQVDAQWCGIARFLVAFSWRTYEVSDGQWVNGFPTFRADPRVLRMDGSKLRLRVRFKYRHIYVKAGSEMTGEDAVKAHPSIGGGVARLAVFVGNTTMPR